MPTDVLVLQVMATGTNRRVVMRCEYLTIYVYVDYISNLH